MEKRCVVIYTRYYDGSLMEYYYDGMDLELDGKELSDKSVLRVSPEDRLWEDWEVEVFLAEDFPKSRLYYARTAEG